MATVLRFKCFAYNQINSLGLPLSIPTAIICLRALLNFKTQSQKCVCPLFSTDMRQKTIEPWKKKLYAECVHFNFVCFLMLLPMLSAEYKLKRPIQCRFVRFACGIFMLNESIEKHVKMCERHIDTEIEMELRHVARNWLTNVELCAEQIIVDSILWARVCFSFEILLRLQIHVCPELCRNHRRHHNDSTYKLNLKLAKQ